MSGQTAIETITHAKKSHKCCWCAEKIIAGDSYNRWRDFYDGAFTVKMHPECHAAWLQWSRECELGDEWMIGDFTRGCTCESGSCPDQTICKTLKDSPQSIDK